MANEHMRSCSTSYVIKETNENNNEILLPIRMARIQSINTTRCHGECRATGTAFSLLVKMKNNLT